MIQEVFNRNDMLNGGIELPPSFLIIGELFEDVFIYGECKRLCSEAPVPVFNIISQTSNLGGAGNVYNNVFSIKKDSNVHFYHQELKLVKTRYIDFKSNHIFLRVDSDESNVDRINLDIDKIKQADIVIVSDYNKGFLQDTDLINIATHSKLCIIDSKRKLKKEIIELFDFVKLNEDESKYNINNDNIITTLSSKGCMYKGILYPSENPQQTIDVSGAGDTFTAAFIIKYYETNNIEYSLQYANYCAGLVVSKKGVTVPF